MNIITLRGHASCGKTTTINIVYDMLIQLGGISTNRQIEGNPILNDFSDIVIFNEKQVAFFSMGDYANELVNAIRNYNNSGVDILVCACNSRFVKPFQEMNKYQHIIINKTIANNIALQNSINNNDAQVIFNLI